MVALVLLAACATNPDKMSAASVSTLRYESYSCKQIAVESERIEEKITRLYGELKKDSQNDTLQMAAGLILFVPILLFLEGGDSAEAAEYRSLKGQYEALQQVSMHKKCDIAFN